MTWSLALHGGAGVMPKTHDYAQEEAHMAALLDRGAALLAAGESALDVVTLMVEALECSGLHVAGKGASPNELGVVELDASIMDGDAHAAGAVAVLVGFASPVRVARAVMERSPHVMLAGEGAARFADAHGLERVRDPASYYRPAVSGIPEHRAESGTVGAVARDQAGRLAAATSTGGVRGKLPGRVGDSPIIGAGCWADAYAAISCTGHGEYFIRANAAANVSARLRFANQSVDEAASSALETVARLGGYGGLIAVDAAGHIAMPFTSAGMKRACADSNGLRVVKTFA